MGTVQKMKFSIKNFFSKRDQRNLLKKSLMEKFIFCAVGLETISYLRPIIWIWYQRKWKVCQAY